MKHTLLTLTITSLLAINAFADPIHDAAKTGDLAGVQAELDKGVDVNEADRGFYNLAPLHYAAGYGFKKLANFLSLKVQMWMRRPLLEELLCLMRLVITRRSSNY